MAFARQVLSQRPAEIDFLEIAPENWLGLGGSRRAWLAQLARDYPLIAHGLCLSLGSTQPLNTAFLDQLKAFLTEFNVCFYSEHLSFCDDGQGYLYDLLPIPFSSDNVRHVSQRIRQVQDRLGQQIAVENSSYYLPNQADLSEAEFIAEVLAEADCWLLLDINNLYVNSQNHGYDPLQFLDKIPLQRIAYVHIAGHQAGNEDNPLIIDTHGAAVMTDVWQLLAALYERTGSLPTLLERDNYIPPMAELLAEVGQIRALQAERQANA